MNELVNMNSLTMSSLEIEICYPDYDFDDLTPEKVDDKLQLAIIK